jgi:hypothetical protein
MPITITTPRPKSPRTGRVGQADVVADEEDVGHLGVHVGQRHVQISTGDLRRGPLAELVETTP